jgi:exosome complex component RRP4
MKTVVLPGDAMPEGLAGTHYTYMSAGHAISKVVGVYDDERKEIMPLEGAWHPRVGNSIVGVVASVDRNTCSIDLRHSSYGVLINDRMSRYRPRVGDVIESVVKSIERKNVPVMDRARPIEESSWLVYVKPSKIPRVLGRNNSMLRQIEELTQTRIIVGLNGFVAISGKGINPAVASIRKIESEAHTPGLTDRIREMLLSIKEYDK